MQEKQKDGNKNISKFNYLEIASIHGMPYICLWGNLLYQPWESQIHGAGSSHNDQEPRGLNSPPFPMVAARPQAFSSELPSSVFSPASHWRGKVTWSLCCQAAGSTHQFCVGRLQVFMWQPHVSEQGSREFWEMLFVSAGAFKRVRG